MRQKRLFRSIFLFLTIFLMVLPFLVTFNDVLTRIVNSLALYRLLQNVIVPIEVQLVGFLISPFHIRFIPYTDGMQVNDIAMKMEWNCLGWQSLLLFLGSLVVGLRGSHYTTMSKLQAVFLGLFGVFWINLLRIVFTVLLAVYAMPLFRVVFHDYLAAIVTTVYLFFFWWFAYSFILEEKNVRRGPTQEL